MSKSTFDALCHQYRYPCTPREYEVYLRYQALPHKLVFTPLTIDICRQHLGQIIPTYFHNGGLDPNNELYGPDMVPIVEDRNDASKVFDMLFMPDNSLRIGNRVMPGWLTDPTTEEYHFTPEEEHAGVYVKGWINWGTGWQDWEAGIVDTWGSLSTHGSGDSWVQVAPQ